MEPQVGTPRLWLPAGQSGHQSPGQLARTRARPRRQDGFKYSPVGAHTSFYDHKSSLSLYRSLVVLFPFFLFCRRLSVSSTTQIVMQARTTTTTATIADNKTK